MAFQNSQWKLTPIQLESTVSLSMAAIPLTDLLRLRIVGAEVLYEWPLHFAEKSWVDIEAFFEAYIVALSSRPTLQAQGDRLEASFAKARLVANTRKST